MQPIELLADDNATQAEVDAQVEAVNAAKAALKGESTGCKRGA